MTICQSLRRKKISGVCGICVAIATLIATRTFAAEYSVVPLSMPVSTYLPNPLGIEPHGMAVVGGVTDVNASSQPVSWASGPPGVLPNPVGAGGVASRINDQGTVVGILFDPVSFPSPVYWNTSGIHYLDVAGAAGGTTAGINSTGTICGTLMYNDGTQQAVIWMNGIATPLGTWGHASSRVAGINDVGQVAITAFSGIYDVGQSGIWSNGSFTPISVPAAAVGLGIGISDGGAVLLQMALSDGSAAFAYWRAGQTTTLTLLPGMATSYPIGIDSAGDAFGISDDGNGTQIPTIWDSAGNPTDVRTLVPIDSGYSAYGIPIINADGVIVVGAYGPAGYQDIELVPDSVGSAVVPEPGSLVVLAVGAAGLLWRRQRRSDVIDGGRGWRSLGFGAWVSGKGRLIGDCP